jgi:ABC-2 type transport system permease protein
LDFDFPNTCHNYAALQMRKTGNAGITFNKTPSLWQIVNGKFLGALLLIVPIIPTFIYVKVISNLAMPEGNIDMGSTIGSYVD